VPTFRLMTMCRRIQRGSLAVVAVAAALAGIVAARPGVALPATQAVDRAVVAPAVHVAAGLGHTGHHALASLRHAVVGTTAATVASTVVPAAALLLIAMGFSVANVRAAQLRRTVAIRAPPGR
jgi:hypothetical protein